MVGYLMCSQTTRSLRYGFSQKELNEKQQWWMEFLENYDCTTSYHLGRGSEVPDALIRNMPIVIGWIAVSDSCWRLIGLPTMNVVPKGSFIFIADLTV